MDDAITSPEHKYVFLVLLEALKKSTGSTGLALSALLETHKHFLDKAPDEIKDLLNRAIRKHIELITSHERDE